MKTIRETLELSENSIIIKEESDVELTGLIPYDNFTDKVAKNLGSDLQSLTNIYSNVGVVRFYGRIIYGEDYIGIEADSNTVTRFASKGISFNTIERDGNKLICIDPDKTVAVMEEDEDDDPDTNYFYFIGRA